MNFKPDEILQVAGTIWEAVLGVAIEPAEWVHTPSRSTAASVEITGAWTGSIILECSDSVAHLAAARMFDAHPAKVTPDDLEDAVAELANMLGGNLKGLLPETCHLSLPMSIPGSDHMARSPGSRVLGRVGFACGGETVSIVVVEKIQEKDVAA